MNLNKRAHWIVNAEEWFKKQLEILTREETSLAIVHVCVIGLGIPK